MQTRARTTELGESRRKHAFSATRLVCSRTRARGVTGHPIVIALLTLGATGVLPPVPPGYGAPPSEKDQRDATDRKIDSQLLYALYALGGESVARGSPGEAIVQTDGDGRALVDVRAVVSPALLDWLRESGGTVASTSDTHRSILVWLPLEKLRAVARRDDVRFVAPAARPTTQ